MPSADPEDQTLAAFERLESDEHAEAATLERAETAAGPVAGLGKAKKRKRGPKTFTPLARGSALGRYVILDQLGIGGMGVVYAAFDPELDRRVAIKLLQTDQDAPEDSTSGHARLLREAQAMARLTHPNVIAVYDVGSFASSVFVAMEYVHGTTIDKHLEQLLEDGPLHWRRVVALYIAAGRGVAAAHAAGIVHRDFKPDNVMVASDGRVLVLDFGLARPTGDASAPSEDGGRDVPAAHVSSGAMSTQLTATGAVMGTPAYMSPEQMTGATTDAPTDQFSFCVALYKGLYGERPFAGTTFADLSSNVLRSRIRDAPRGAKVPQWIRRVLLRGLQRRPGDRYATMNELLEALQRDPARRRRNIALSVVGVLLLGGAAAVGAQMGPGSDPCSQVADGLEAVWNDGRRDAVRAAFDEVGKAYVDDTFEKLVPVLDDYAAQWTAHRVEACTATRVTGSQSDEVLGLRMACLDRRLYRLDTLVDTLQSADQAAVTESLSAAHALPDLQPCADTEALLSGVRPPEDPEVRREVEQIRLESERALGLAVLGRIEEGRALADALLTRAEALPYPPIVADMLAMLAEFDVNLGHAEAARARAMRALLLAEAHGVDNVIVGSLILLAQIDGSQLNEFARGQEHAERAEAVLQRMGNPITQRTRLTTIRGNLATSRGDWDQAIEYLQDALALITEAGDAEEPRVFPTLNSLGMAYIRQERLEEASVIVERSLRLGQEKLGAGHPNVGVTYAMLGRLRSAQGRDGEAVDPYNRARAIFVSALGPAHGNVAAMDNALGLVYVGQGELDKALEAYNSALTLTQKARGEGHLDVAAVLSNLGSLKRRLGRWEEALAHHQRGYEIKRDRLGPDHAEIGFSHDNLGDDYRVGGDFDRAMEHYELSVAHFERIEPDDDKHLSYALSGIGMVHLDRGRPDLAVPVLERAVQIDAAHDGDPADNARAEFPLARALWQQGDKARAITMAKRAEAGLAINPTGDSETLAKVRTWLAEHPAP